MGGNSVDCECCPAGGRALVFCPLQACNYTTLKRLRDTSARGNVEIGGIVRSYGAAAVWLWVGNHRKLCALRSLRVVESVPLVSPFHCLSLCSLHPQKRTLGSSKLHKMHLIVSSEVQVMALEQVLSGRGTRTLIQEY